MSNHPLVSLPRTAKPLSSNEHELMLELQSNGLQLVDALEGAPSRRGGAGPSDHKAVLVGGRPIMVPVHTSTALSSPFVALSPDISGESKVFKDGVEVGRVRFPTSPRFYELKTADGIPYSHIATLHGADVLATTVLQTCIRYDKPDTACQFCAIGQSLAAKRTLARKTPQQLAEVAKAAVELDGVRHMVMTTGTPNRADRGAKVLAESAEAIRATVDLPLQAQCEPPDDFAWFRTMRSAGIDALGLHLEAVTPPVRRRIMPGKAEVSMEKYMEAFEQAVTVFGWGQVSTYILAGLGDSAEDILAMCEDLVALGVYPFVVPFVPISGTPLENHPAPDPGWMRSILEPLAQHLRAAGMTRETIKAGCGRCGACSSLSAFEERG
ncbi:MAG: MSMEG_0568 family radical SAM protein [Myxococcales bacterium]|nr:MSMEG_0568 family radical SAM protein [Myxococcales bacterium]